MRKGQRLCAACRKGIGAGQGVEVVDRSVHLDCLGRALATIAGEVAVSDVISFVGRAAYNTGVRRGLAAAAGKAKGGGR